MSDSLILKVTVTLNWFQCLIYRLWIHSGVYQVQVLVLESHDSFAWRGEKGIGICRKVPRWLVGSSATGGTVRWKFLVSTTCPRETSVDIIVIKKKGDLIIIWIIKFWILHKIRQDLRYCFMVYDAPNLLVLHERVSRPPVFRLESRGRTSPRPLPREGLKKLRVEETRMSEAFVSLFPSNDHKEEYSFD